MSESKTFPAVRDFSKDRRTILDRKDGYVNDGVFAKYADKGWPEALDRITELENQLRAAAITAMGGNATCPYWEVEEFETRECGKCICNGATKDKAVSCWLKYWRQTVRNGRELK